MYEDFLLYNGCTCISITFCQAFLKLQFLGNCIHNSFQFSIWKEPEVNLGVKAGDWLLALHKTYLCTHTTDQKDSMFMNTKYFILSWLHSWYCNAVTFSKLASTFSILRGLCINVFCARLENVCYSTRCVVLCVVLFRIRI